jgi:protein-tyrosine phosphatase
VLDFHNHLIPAVDDGAASLEQSLTALARMWDQGIRHVVTTPHFRASTLTEPTLFDEEMGRLDAGWQTLLVAASSSFPAMRLDRGVELALDEPNVSIADARILLAGSRFVLVEFPYLTIPPNSVRPLSKLRTSGVTPIVAHPERYENLDSDLAILHAWRREGAFLQLNAGSLVGAYGTKIERIAWQCLEAGSVDYLSSDYHARGKCAISEASDRLVGRSGSSQLEALTLNGYRILRGLDPMPVNPLARRKSGWEGWKAAFRRRP